VSVMSWWKPAWDSLPLSVRTRSSCQPAADSSLAMRRGELAGQLAGA
jgi:hypothetical protein